MKLRYKLVIVAFVVTVIGSFIWSAGHYYSKYQHEKERADEAVRNAESATAITRNVLQSLQIVNTVLEANQHAKQQIALESQRFEVSRCAVTLCWQQSNSPDKEQEYIYAPSNSKSLPRSRLP